MGRRVVFRYVKQFVHGDENNNERICSLFICYIHCSTVHKHVHKACTEQKKCTMLKYSPPKQYQPSFVHVRFMPRLYPPNQTIAWNCARLISERNTEAMMMRVTGEIQSTLHLFGKNMKNRFGRACGQHSHRHRKCDDRRVLSSHV